MPSTTPAADPARPDVVLLLFYRYGFNIGHPCTRADGLAHLAALAAHRAARRWWRPGSWLWAAPPLRGPDWVADTTGVVAARLVVPEADADATQQAAFEREMRRRQLELIEAQTLAVRRAARPPREPWQRDDEEG